MADRLHQELLAVPGLEQVTALQFQELPWKVREQVLIALFQEHASSSAVAEELRVKSRDRRLERKTEKAENLERDVVRKNEERFRSEFMQVAATELSRLGAPAMVTWQKLVFDRDCCAQAFRILLTKIKSSKRSNNSAAQSARLPIALAKRFSQTEDGTQAAENDTPSQITPQEHEQTQETLLPRIPSGLKSTNKARGGLLRQSTKHSLAASSDWNSDTTINESERGRCDDRLEDDSSFNSPEISIRRTTIKPTATSSSMFAAKLKKSQLDSLHQENAMLRSENTALRNEVTHLEELVATLQLENNQTVTGSQDEFHRAGMRLLRAQNMQLQRQVSLFQDAIQVREEAESMLLTALSQWRELVEAGREEAKAAGAEEHAKTKGGKPVQWMMAVPERLLDELNRVEGQIDHARKTVGLAQEAKLRVGGSAAEFLRHSSSSIPFKDLYVPGVAHLRPERVKILETKLFSALHALESMHDLVINNAVPKISDGSRRQNREGGRSLSQEIDTAISLVRKAALEVGAFGIVVPCADGIQRQVDRDDLVRVDQVLRAYTASTAPSSGVSVKDREKQLKVMLRQLLASEAAADREINRLRKELAYWKNAWAMQEEVFRTLIQRVRSVGDKKMQWAEANLIHPLRDLHEVWTSFQRTQSQQDQRLHKNAYLPLLIDTLQQHEPVLCMETIEQWHEHSLRYNQDIRSLLDDYEANCSLLQGQLGQSPAT